MLVVVLFTASCARLGFFRPAPQRQDFPSTDRIVGTYYFYWYKYPSSHFFDDARHSDDALTDHFPNPKVVDFESVQWHMGELADMAWCGIDFVLPVYWGAPGNYDRGLGYFSTRGLDAMQKAREQLLAQGRPCPRFGMFYDTTTLLNNLRGDRPAGGKADLTTTHGMEVFYCTIRDYWRRLDRKHWATLDGRPLTVLYSAGFAAAYNQAAFDFVYREFEKDFGVRPYILADTSWRKVKPDGFYSWGAALAGPAIRDAVAIGPGYNDSAVPGRRTPIRDRENGRFYEYSWIEAIRSGRNIVLLETWNEMHEGTDICHSAEHGRQYLELTRKYVRLFKKGERPEQTVSLRHPKPLPRGPTTEGREFADSTAVSINFASGENRGLRIVRQADGGFQITEAAGKRCVQSARADHTYLYFAVPDPFYYGQKQPVVIEFEYLDSGQGRLVLEYDSHDEKLPHDGAYKTAGAVVRKNSGRWTTHSVWLDDARLCGRQNGGSDFRIAVFGDPLCVSRVTVRK